MDQLAGHMVGRWADIAHDEREVRALATGMDFRDPRYRREVFIRFYMFHLRYRSHPGCVYYLMPYLEQAYRWDIEQKLWYAFINGCTQHPVTSLVIFREFPKVPTTPYQQKVLADWFNEQWAALPFDTDRRYQKRDFPAAVAAYAEWLGGLSQISAWGRYCMDRDPQVNFDATWKTVRNDLVSFGRLGTWSFLEYLKIMGLPLEPSSMMLRDMDGSKSHRNGLAKVLGRDDLDWQKGGAFQGKYSPQVLEWLEREADLLLEETRTRWHASSWGGFRDGTQDISRFTLESALCTFKGWFRKDRRYPNVYNDMLRDRIQHVQQLRPQEDLQVFWDARRAALPVYLRVEDCPGDPGLAKPKQNHFRLTGQVIMMDHEWSVFRNDGSWKQA